MINRVGLFVDISNIYYCVFERFGSKVNYARYMDVAKGDGEIYRAYAYGAQLRDEATKFLACLRTFGYEPRYKRPKEFTSNDSRVDMQAIDNLIRLVRVNNLVEPVAVLRAEEAARQAKSIVWNRRDFRKADWDVGLTIDVVRYIDRLDTVVIGSADSDLAPLVSWVRERGCRCVVYGCNISRELQEAANIAIEIDQSVIEPRQHVENE
ncbi:MAG TPA: NYN domain-containing protein [Pirellula sp.]|nr:NYN domain-containing protein [Pirellula sp.]